MQLSTAVCWVWVSLTVALHCSVLAEATPLALNVSAEGSGEADELEMIPTASRSPSLAPPTAGGSLGETQVEPFTVSRLVDFLRENLFPILVISSLLVLVIVIVSCASVLSHRHKVSAYYPCSFPAKMYVDQRDKAGGAKLFSEVPEKAAEAGQREPAKDSARRLQDDILMIAKNLRSPAKAVRVDREPREPAPKPKPKPEEAKSPVDADAAQQGPSASGPEASVSKVTSDELREGDVHQPAAPSPDTHTGRPEGSEGEGPGEGEGLPEEGEGLPKEGDSSSEPQSSKGPQETAETQETDTSELSLSAAEKTAF
ncbi:hypothetical protein ACEWY4_004905 [Coilia grayii]|uniref:Transmembrane protein 119 n=1 Tax=Coilia grayii TaxID=363190 RepID=A0ABD1KMY3_9TELE